MYCTLFGIQKQELCRCFSVPCVKQGKVNPCEFCNFVTSTPTKTGIKQEKKGIVHKPKKIKKLDSIPSVTNYKMIENNFLIIFGLMVKRHKRLFSLYLTDCLQDIMLTLIDKYRLDIRNICRQLDRHFYNMEKLESIPKSRKNSNITSELNAHVNLIRIHDNSVQVITGNGTIYISADLIQYGISKAQDQDY